MKAKKMDKILLKEELDNRDKEEIKKMIEKQLVRLFYQLYVKKTFWSQK